MSELFIAANTAAPAPAGKTVNAAPAAPAKPVANAPVAAPNAPAKPVAAAPGKQEVPPPAPKGAAEKPAPVNAWIQMLPFILIFVVMIFFMNRSQKKQMQKRQEMMDKIAKGTKVLLNSGIYGTVDAVNEDSMIVEIATGVKVKVAKAGIAGIDAPNAEVK